MDNKYIFSPKITIITVVYNGGTEIERTILSVINQKYTNIEYIIIDGGSSDNTCDVILKYSNSISTWISEPDKGIYDAMNKGIDISTGDYMLFLNCGDCLCNNLSFTRIVAAISDWSNVDVIYGNLIFKYSFGAFSAKPLAVDLMPHKFPIYHPASLTKADLLKRIRFDDTFQICADYNFFYTLYKSNAVFKYVDIPFSIFSAETGVSSTNISQRIKEESIIKNQTYNKFFILIQSFFILLLLIIRRIIPNKLLIKRRIKRLLKQTNWELVHVDEI